MTVRPHVMLQPFSDRIIVANMRSDGQGRLIATTEPIDVTEEAEWAVIQYLRRLATKSGMGKIAYEYTIGNDRIILKLTVESEKMGIEGATE